MPREILIQASDGQSKTYQLTGDRVTLGRSSTTELCFADDAGLSRQHMALERDGEEWTVLKALIHAGQELAGNTPLAELFKKILDLSIEAVGAQRGVLMTLEGDRLVVRANKGEGFRISSAVRDRVLKEKNSLLVKDTQMDDAFRERLSIVEQKVRTLMAVPLQTKDHIIGLIYLDSPFFVREFTVDDLNLLTVMANTAAIRIENARLVEVEQAERIMARDLDQAADLQRRFLPSAPPDVPGVDIAGYNAPCRTVGGDYYDFFSYQNGRVALALGDVSGKGMPASLMMMGLQARVQQALIDEPEDLGLAMTRINKITCPKCPSNRFITFFFCVMDPATGELSYANAGHNPPFLVRATGEVSMLPGGGPPLGIIATAVFAEESMTMSPGDVLAIYSDGVTEAQNPNEEEFSEERFEAVLAANRKKSAGEIVIAVNRALGEWAQGGPPADDITMVIAKRL
jgi:serine phosphatase RsbU (regulator of sigma subunit)